jgi:hypothetical protein
MFLYVSGEKSTYERKGKLEQFDAAFKTIFRICTVQYSKCFKRSKQKLYIYFPLSQTKNLKTSRTCTESTDLIV